MPANVKNNTITAAAHHTHTLPDRERLNAHVSRENSRSHDATRAIWSSTGVWLPRRKPRCDSEGEEDVDGFSSSAYGGGATGCMVQT